MMVSICQIARCLDASRRDSEWQEAELCLFLVTDDCNGLEQKLFGTSYAAGTGFKCGCCLKLALSVTGNLNS